MTTCSTHVLDAALGRPASGVPVELRGPDGPLETAATDADGRVRFAGELGAGDHTLIFATGAWFAGQDRATLYPEVALGFTVDADESHYHLALLLSPFSYTTYRGS